jgi:lipopolysaccharide transport system ATP-binding protein
MSKSIIKINNLSKCYRIGTKEKGYKTFREAIIDGISAPFRNLKKLQRLTRFNNNGNNERSNDIIWALRDISCEIDEGEVLGIIGRNGAGKSTLLKILSRITEPTGGIIEINGRVSSLLEVGTGFHPELTGRENIFLNGAVLGMRKREIEEKFDEIVSFAEIEKFLDTPVKRYSSGMYVRLAFAVAAHLEPEILLVDEVLAVGDIAFQKKCLGKMGEVAKGGRTVLFVSHNMESIQKLCTQAILLHEGTVLMKGSTDEVISNYLGEKMKRMGEQIWSNINKAPGDDVVRVHAIRVLDRNRKVCTNFDVRDPVSIEIEYWVLEEDHHLCVHLNFINEMGHVLFITKDNLDSTWRDTVSPTGHYRSICHIPRDFLNEGEFSVYCAITTVGMTNIGHVSEEDVVVFRVSDRMDTRGVRGNYPLYWSSGGVRPRLHWTVETN